MLMYKSNIWKAELLVCVEDVKTGERRQDWVANVKSDFSDTIDSSVFWDRLTENSYPEIVRFSRPEVWLPNERGAN